MNTRQLPAILVSVLLLVGAGCSLGRRSPTLPAFARQEWFDSYEAVFRNIAQREGLPTDRRTLFELAADSTTESFQFDQTGILSIVRADWHGELSFGIRGAQGQGRYYAFQRKGNRWRLVGILHGNSYRWEYVNHELRVVTRWHLSAAERPETTYTWRQGQFEPQPCPYGTDMPNHK